MVWVAFGGGGGGGGTSFVLVVFFFFFFSFCGGLVALALATHPIKMKISTYAGRFVVYFCLFLAKV